MPVDVGLLKRLDWECVSGRRGLLSEEEDQLSVTSDIERCGQEERDFTLMSDSFTERIS